MHPSDAVEDSITYLPVHLSKDEIFKVCVLSPHPGYGGREEGLVIFCSSREGRVVDHPAEEKAF